MSDKATSKIEMTGEQIIPALQAEVWRNLNDPEVLKACITGCESIEKLTDSEYTVVTTATAGPAPAAAEPSTESAPGAAPLWWVIAIIAAMFVLAYLT